MPRLAPHTLKKYGKYFNIFNTSRGGQSGTLYVFLNAVTYWPTLSKIRGGPVKKNTLYKSRFPLVVARTLVTFPSSTPVTGTRWGIMTRLRWAAGFWIQVEKLSAISTKQRVSCHSIVTRIKHRKNCCESCPNSTHVGPITPKLDNCNFSSFLLNQHSGPSATCNNI